MNFTTATKLIAYFVFSSIVVAKAASFRGNAPRELRPINPGKGQGGGNGNKKEISCTLYLKEILLEPEILSGDPLKDLANARTVTSWSCEVDDKEINGNAYGINNNERKNFKRFLDLKGVDKAYLDEHANSGNSILKVSGAKMKFEELEITEEATFVVEDIPEDRRRLAPSLGALKTKVIRVSGNNGATSPTPTAAQLKDDIFDDASCLKSQFASCSHGALTIIEGPIEEVTVATDPGGPADVTRGWMEGNATALVAKGDYDLVLFCQPQTTGGWIAYAYINHWRSYYNNNWCQYVSVQLHEVGHNMGLAHAGEARVEYGDQTGMMGYSYSLDDQFMCFNPVNYYQLGWFPGQVADVAASTHMGSHAFVLNGVESAESFGAVNGKKIAMRVTNVNLEDTNLCCIAQQYYTDWRIRDIYIGYNFVSSSGINRDTVKYRNHVTVHQKDSNNPSAYSQSWLLAALQEGQEYTFPNFDGLGEGHTLHIKFSDQVNEDAFIEMFVTGLAPTPSPATNPPTNEPTRLPTPSPTDFPTSPPPTATPTKSPTSTIPPTPEPTRLPTSSPTDFPTSPPPTATPTKSPTSTIPPTPEPTRLPTSSPNDFPTSLPPTATPTKSPTTTIPPTNEPTRVPTPSPTVFPTSHPTKITTPLPTFSPTHPPTDLPTLNPTSSITPIFANQDFELNFGSVFISGGKNSIRVLYSNRYCIRLSNKTGPQSSMYTKAWSVSGNNGLRLEFDYYSKVPFLVEWRGPKGSWVTAAVIGAVQTGFVRAKVDFDSWVRQGKPGSIQLRIRSNTNNAVTYVDNVVFYGIQ